MRTIASSLAVAAALMVAACGQTTTTSTIPATAIPTALASRSPVVTAASSPAAATADQSIAVGKAIFPAVSGGYLECDKDLSNVSVCPLSARLKAEIAHYYSNYKAQCPGGCGGALLIVRDQCGAFPNESVTNAPNPAIAIVTLSGDTTCRGADKTFYVSVIVEGGRPVADDIYCNVGDPKYGMYNPDQTATLPPVCAS